MAKIHGIRCIASCGSPKCSSRSQRLTSRAAARASDRQNGVRVCLVGIQDKAEAFAESLGRAGHDFVGPEAADVILCDYPVPWHPPRLEMIAQVVGRGGVAFEYPHGGGMPMVQYDGIAPACPDLSGNLVVAPGHAEVLALCGYPHPCEVVGWPYCPVLPFKPPEAVNSVLFAPAHPWGDGVTQTDFWKRKNRAAYEAFLAFPAERKTVRMVGTFGGNGIWREPGVRYVDANLSLDWQDIDRADVVISDCTYLTLALARGKPAIAVSASHKVTSDDGERTTARWGDYADLIRYPFEVGQAPFPELVDAACVGGPDVDRWKTLFVGEQFKPIWFAKRLVELVREAVGCRESRPTIWTPPSTVLTTTG